MVYHEFHVLREKDMWLRESCQSARYSPRRLFLRAYKRPRPLLCRGITPSSRRAVHAFLSSVVLELNKFVTAPAPVPVFFGNSVCEISPERGKPPTAPLRLSASIAHASTLTFVREDVVISNSSPAAAQPASGTPTPVQTPVIPPSV